MIVIYILKYAILHVCQSMYVFISDVLSDFGTFRDQNPSLKVIASIGGESLDAETFSSLITEVNKKIYGISCHFMTNKISNFIAHTFNGSICMELTYSLLFKSEKYT